MHPTISVIVIVKNGEEFLQTALMSILDQSLPPAEILVIDGHSTDKTQEIARSFPNVRYVQQVGNGIATAYNEGIMASRGELIAFLSHDDIWHREKLEKQTAVLIQKQELDYVVCHATFFSEDPSSLPPGFRPHLLEGDHVAFIMETLLAKRSLFTSIGLFDSSYRISEDVDWYSRVRDAGIKGGVIQEALLRKRVHSKNSSLCDPNGNQYLLRILKNSIERKKAKTYS